MGRLSQAPPLAGLLPAHGTFQGHAAHLVERSTTLSPNDSWGACTPTWDYLTCQAGPFIHSKIALHGALQCVVRPRRRPRVQCPFPRCGPPQGRRGERGAGVVRSWAFCLGLSVLGFLSWPVCLGPSVLACVSWGYCLGVIVLAFLCKYGVCRGLTPRVRRWQ